MSFWSTPPNIKPPSNNNNSISFSVGATNSQNNSIFGFNNNASSNNANANTNNSTTFWGSNNPANQAANSTNDVLFQNPPNDSISCLKASPTSDLIAVTSWNNQVLCYQHQGTQTRLMGNQQHTKAALSCCWDANGENIFSSGCDNTIRVWNIKQNQFNQLGIHNAPVPCIDINNQHNIAISGSWDRSIIYWDIRSKQKAMNPLNVNQKVFKLCTQANYLAVGLSNFSILEYDLRKPTQVFNEVNGTKKCGKFNKQWGLKHQVSCMDTFDGGYMAASVAGRVCIRYFNSASKDFSFKCHRSVSARTNNVSFVFSVNVLRFHKQSKMFVSAGDDGQIMIWDKDNRSKVHTYPKMKLNMPNQSTQGINEEGMPITGLDYSRNGNIMFYATSYNWNKGLQYYNQQKYTPQIYMHQIKQSEYKYKK